MIRKIITSILINFPQLWGIGVEEVEDYVLDRLSGGEDYLTVVITAQEVVRELADDLPGDGD